MVEGPRLPRHSSLADAAWAQHLHEMRTPLTVVVARVQLLRRRLRRGEEPTHLDADLEIIEAALVRLTAAIERMDREAGQG